MSVGICLLLRPGGEGISYRRRIEQIRNGIGHASLEVRELVLAGRRTQLRRFLYELDETVRQCDPVCSVVTVGPFLSGYAAVVALSDVWNVPTVLDVRDPWLNNPFASHGHRGVLARVPFSALERSAMRRSQVVTACSDGLVHYARDRGARFAHCIYTGSQSNEDLAAESEIDARLPGWRQWEASGSVFYAGSIGGKQYPVAPVIRALLEESTYRVIVASNTVLPFEHRRLIQTGQLSPELCQRIHRLASMSLIVEGGPGSSAPYSVPAKVFECIAASNAVIGWMPRAEGRRLLEDYGRNVRLSAPGDVRSVVRSAVAVENLHRQRGTDLDGKRRISAEYGAEKIGNILDCIRLRAGQAARW